MNKSKCFSNARRLRSLWTASAIIAIWGLGIGTALAAQDSDAVQDSVEKTGRGFGELLKGMGQEVKKVINSDDAKKDKKKEAKHSDEKSDKDK